MVGLLGQKLGQTRVYDADGSLVPVTIVLAGPNRVLQCKTKATDGYDAVQLGFGPQKLQRLPKPLVGHLTKYGALGPRSDARAESKPEGAASPAKPDSQPGEKSESKAESKPEPKATKPDDKRPAAGTQVLTGVARLREFRDFSLSVKPGDLVGPSLFQAGDFVDAIGVTKGRGFEGVVKRHHFRGGDQTHGSKGWHRRSGAIGQRLFPGTVRRGLRMPGHMGQVRRTVQNLRVIHVLPEDHLLLIHGAIPGANGDYVVIRESKKIPKAAVEEMRKAKAKAVAAAKAKEAAKGQVKGLARVAK